MSHSVLRILPKYVNCGTLLIASPAMEKDGLLTLCWLASCINNCWHVCLTVRHSVCLSRAGIIKTIYSQIVAIQHYCEFVTQNLLQCCTWSCCTFDFCRQLQWVLGSHRSFWFNVLQFTKAISWLLRITVQQCQRSKKPWYAHFRLGRFLLPLPPPPVWVTQTVRWLDVASAVQGKYPDLCTHIS